MFRVSKTKLLDFKNKYMDLNDKGLLWEVIKMEIRAFSVSVFF